MGWPQTSCLAVAAILLAGCATPEGVKLATAEMDRAYRENLTLMRHYEALTIEVSERHALLWKDTTRRTLLALAIAVATRDSLYRGDAQQEVRELLGKEVFDQLDSELMLDSVPALVHAVGRRTDELYARSVTDHSAGFAGYYTNVQALRDINAAIRAYLDVDVEVGPDR